MIVFDSPTRSSARRFTTTSTLTDVSDCTARSARRSRIFTGTIDPKGGGSEVNQDDFALQDWRGDYDTLATDSLNQSAGFIGGYTDTSPGYQNIRRNRFS